MKCLVCNVEFESKRPDAKYCSPKHRKLAFQKRSIGTDNPQNGTDKLVIEERIIEPEIYFEFYTISKANGLGRKQDEKSSVRKAKYWYDVPIAAIPVIKKGFPEMPETMNGRQYFLWWQNEFKMSDKFPDSPEIVNPLPTRGELIYVKASEGSRYWGTV